MTNDELQQILQGLAERNFCEMIRVRKESRRISLEARIAWRKQRLNGLLRAHNEYLKYGIGIDRALSISKAKCKLNQARQRLESDIARRRV
jgi:hypothetical protein